MGTIIKMLVEERAHDDTDTGSVKTAEDRSRDCHTSRKVEEGHEDYSTSCNPIACKVRCIAQDSTLTEEE